MVFSVVFRLQKPHEAVDGESVADDTAGDTPSQSPHIFKSSAKWVTQGG